MRQYNRRYKLPTLSEVALKPALSARLKDLWASASHSNFELFLYAAAIRKHHLQKKSDDYNDAFKEFYSKHELNTVFGKLPTFTKYAMAGEAVNYFANQFHDGKYVEQLPFTRSALYELWLLINDITPEDLIKLFYSGGPDGEALIQPSTSGADIASYRARQSAKPQLTGGRRNRKFTIPLATIYVSRELYKFNTKTGAHEGSVDLGSAKSLLQELQGLLDTKAFDVRTNIKRITKTYEKKMENASPARALRKAADKAK